MRMPWLGAVAAIALATVGVAAPVGASCVTAGCGPERTEQVERERSRIQRQCACPVRADRPTAYRRCVKTALRALAPGTLPKACLRAIAGCERASICGTTSSAVVCCTRRNGALVGAIAPNASACRGLACQQPRHVDEVCVPSTRLRIGPLVPRNETVLDRHTGLEWERKQPHAGPTAPHGLENRFAWAGTCAGAPALCQPTSAATAGCRAQTPPALQAACEPCAAGAGPCRVDPSATTTVWDWLAAINADGFAGHGDWRLPTVADEGAAPELETIVDPVYAGCRESRTRLMSRGHTLLFGTEPTGPFWSATTVGFAADAAYTVDARRVSAARDKRAALQVRAVRTP